MDTVAIADTATCLPLTVTVYPIPLSDAYSPRDRRLAAAGPSAATVVGTAQLSVTLPELVAPAISATGSTVTLQALVPNTGPGVGSTTLSSACTTTK
jgi:hypothetical protein